jgi:hypothetical protein
MTWRMRSAAYTLEVLHGRSSHYRCCDLFS